MLSASDGLILSADGSQGSKGSTWIRGGEARFESARGLLQLYAAPHITLLEQAGEGGEGFGQVDISSGSVGITSAGGHASMTARSGDLGFGVADLEGRAARLAPR